MTMMVSVPRAAGAAINSKAESQRSRFTGAVGVGSEGWGERAFWTGGPDGALFDPPPEDFFLHFEQAVTDGGHDIEAGVGG